MNRRIPSLAVVLLLTAPLAAPALHEPSADLERPFTLDLEGAAAADVFESFASILEAMLVMDPAIDGLVTVQLQEVPLQEAMEVVCEDLGCVFGIDEGPPRRLIVKSHEMTLGQPRPPAGDLDTRIDMSVRDAGARHVLESFASIGGWKLDMGEPEVTIEIDDTPIREALDQVCIQIGCVWTLDQGAEAGGTLGVLRIEWLE